MTEYCGFVCADVVEKAREIRKELDDFAKYNSNEAKQVKLNVLNALGIDVVKLIKDIEEFIPKIDHHRSMDVLLKRAIAMVVWESLDLMKTRPITNEELGIKPCQECGEQKWHFHQPGNILYGPHKNYANRPVS